MIKRVLFGLLVLCGALATPQSLGITAGAGDVLAEPSKEETIDFITKKLRQFHDGTRHKPSGYSCNHKLEYFKIDSTGNMEIIERIWSDGKDGCEENKYFYTISLQKMDYSKVNAYNPEPCDHTIRLYCYDNQECVKRTLRKPNGNSWDDKYNVAFISLYSCDVQEEAVRLQNAFSHLIKVVGGKKELF